MRTPFVKHGPSDDLLRDPNLSFRLSAPSILKTAEGQLALQQLKRLGWNSGLIQTLHDQMADRPGAMALFGLLPGDAKIKKEREKMAEALRKLLKPFYTNMYVRVAAKITVLQEASKLAEHALDHVIDSLEAEIEGLNPLTSSAKSSSKSSPRKPCDHPLCDFDDAPNHQNGSPLLAEEKKLVRTQKIQQLQEARAEKSAMHTLHKKTLPALRGKMVAAPPPEDKAMQKIERDIDTQIERSQTLQHTLGNIAKNASGFGKKMGHSAWSALGDVVDYLKTDSPKFFKPSNLLKAPLKPFSFIDSDHKDANQASNSTSVDYDEPEEDSPKPRVA